MFVKQLKNCKEFVAGDGSLLRELLHPGHETEKLQIDYSLAHAIVKPGQTTTPHMLRTSSEVYYILQGEGIMTIDNESQRVVPGDAVYIPPSSVQHIRNVGEDDLVFLCLVSPPWHENDEVVYEKEL